MSIKSEKKKLINDFANVIEDLMDNYEKYTEQEQNEIQEMFNLCMKLNESLNKYDKEKWYEKVSNKFQKLKRSFNNFFGGK